MSPDNDVVRGDRFGSTIESWQLSQCLDCVHRDDDAARECAAFPDMKIPFEIIENRFDHRQAHPQDNGLQYEPENDWDHPMDRMRQGRPG